MPVIADVNAHASVASLEDRISGVTRSEVKLLPESWSDLRNVVLAIFAEILSVRIDHRSRVEIETGHLFFVNRDDNHHLVFGRDLLHQFRGWAIGHALRHLIPLLILFRAKVRAVEEFLKTEYLHLLLRGLLDELQVLVDHGFLDLSQAVIWAKRIARLNEAAADNSRHYLPRVRKFQEAEYTTRCRLANSRKSPRTGMILRLEGIRA